jgi:hypothetical protein
MAAPIYIVPQHFEHALVVGGTGMLANATRFLRARSERMTLAARGAREAAASLLVLPDEACSVDWRDEAAFAAVLSPRLAAAPPDVALLWMHGSGHNALMWLLEQLVLQPVLIVHVLGSSSGDPRGGDPDINAMVSNRLLLHYVTVLLGSRAISGGRRRWLTDVEISAGAIEAIQTGRDVVVGELVRLG